MARKSGRAHPPLGAFAQHSGILSGPRSGILGATWEYLSKRRSPQALIRRLLRGRLRILPKPPEAASDSPMVPPKNIQLIGDQIAIVWQDGAESYIEASKLRAASPSAATTGERDILGNLHGGEFDKDYSEAQVLDWQFVGTYAIRFRFSDGHASGLYSYELLRELG